VEAVVVVVLLHLIVLLAFCMFLEHLIVWVNFAAKRLQFQFVLPTPTNVMVEI
jgi:hypothetical protein